MTDLISEEFYDLTPENDTVTLIPGLLSDFPGGLRGLAGNDSIIGSLDPEFISGNDGNDTLFGLAGNDTLNGDLDNDLLNGNLDHDLLNGNQGDDQLFGEDGSDTLNGGQGNDVLVGGNGDDRLRGDDGRDTFIGDLGDDVFILSRNRDGDNTLSADWIYDWGNGSDRIGLPAGFTFDQIELVASSVGGLGVTRIQVVETGELFAIALNVAPDTFTADAFFTADERVSVPTEPLTPASIFIDVERLPAPDTSASVSQPANVIEIPEEPILQVPEGFTVNVFAENLENPRWMAVTPTGDLLVTETAANRITLLRDLDGDGDADTTEVFADVENGLNAPFGMAFAEDGFYLANTDAILKFPYVDGQTQLEGTGEVIATLPTTPGDHWTRNIALSPDGEQLYVSIGSASNVSPEPSPRASIQVINLNDVDPQLQPVATGLRNPVGLDFYPETNQLFTTVIERDGLGPDLVPDFLTGIEPGEFYGWPYAYVDSSLPDPRRAGERPDLVAQTATPDVLFQAHSTPLGLQFYEGDTFPEEYENGAFVAFRGSWNRDPGTGFKLVYVPFDAEGNPTGGYQDFLTGFLTDPDTTTTWGRPTGLQTLADGSLLVTEEANNRIYRIQFDPTLLPEEEETTVETVESMVAS